MNDLERLRGLSEKATAGPWEVNTAHTFDNGKPWIIWGPKGVGWGCVANVVPYCPPATFQAEEEKAATANFIVACVNYVRSLLADSALGVGESWQLDGLIDQALMGYAAGFTKPRIKEICERWLDSMNSCSCVCCTTTNLGCVCLDYAPEERCDCQKCLKHMLAVAESAALATAPPEGETGPTLKEALELLQLARSGMISGPATEGAWRPLKKRIDKFLKSAALATAPPEGETEKREHLDMANDFHAPTPPIAEAGLREALWTHKLTDAKCSCGWSTNVMGTDRESGQWVRILFDEQEIFKRWFQHLSGKLTALRAIPDKSAPTGVPGFYGDPRDSK